MSTVGRDTPVGRRPKSLQPQAGRAAGAAVNRGLQSWRHCGVLLLVWAAAGPKLIAAGLPAKARIQELFAEVASIAQLPVERPVRYEALDWRRLREDLDRRVRRSAKESEIRDEELALKWLGLVPPEFNLRESTVDLLTEQAAAFYDYRKRRLVLLENPLGEYEDSVIAHELAHALADQHFRIGRYMRGRGRTDDAVMARLAVVEGQASWLMTEMELRRQKRGSLFTDSSLLPSGSAVETGRSFGFPVLEKAPLYLRASLLFPYWEGARFQAAVVQRAGRDAFRRVFEQPPTTTQQILHPELYWEGRGAEEVQLPKWTGGRSRVVSAGVLGELDFLILFQLADVSDARSLAARWRGSRYEVRERGRACCAVRVSSLWREEADAAIVAVIWRRWVEQKAWRGQLKVTRTGRRVDAVEGEEYLQPK